MPPPRARVDTAGPGPSHGPGRHGEATMRWIGDNRVIGVIFAVLLVVNAFAMTAGWYG